MTEAQLLEAVRELARWHRWLTYHTYRSTRSEPGWPDLVLAHPASGRLMIVELKTDRGSLTRPQLDWLTALKACGVDVRVWRPRDLRSGEIARALTPISKER